MSILLRIPIYHQILFDIQFGFIQPTSRNRSRKKSSSLNKTCIVTDIDGVIDLNIMGSFDQHTPTRHAVRL